MSDSALAAQRVDRRGRTARRARLGDRFAPYMFLSPFLISFVALFLGPALYSLVLSLYRYRGYGSATWVGLANYKTVLDYHVFWSEIGNTVIYWLGHMIPLLALAYLLAVLVQSKMVKAKSFFKPVIFMPQVVAPVAAALIFQDVFTERAGLIDTLLHTQIPWLQDMGLVKIAVIILLIWRGTGWWFVIFLAGLTGINADLYEAATVDGASAWQRLLYITTPLMRNVFLFAFVIDTISSFRLFTEPNVLVSAAAGGLAPPAMGPILNLLVTYLQGAQFGPAASVGWIMFLLLALVSWVQFRIFRQNQA